jgi:hypothetical protein
VKAASIVPDVSSEARVRELARLRAACVDVARLLDPDRDPPLAGWCVEVALAVRGIFGGTVREAPIPDAAMHYWNRLPDGTEVDLTSDQIGGDGFRPVLTDSHEAWVPTPVPLPALLFAQSVLEALRLREAS